MWINGQIMFAYERHSESGAGLQINFRLSPAGLLGPMLRGEQGETIVVTFRNMADRPYSLHPHGIAYGKQSEGGCLLTPTHRTDVVAELQLTQL